VSDVPQGPGWWQASDARWYPPEQFTGTTPSPPPPPTAAPVPDPAAPPPPMGVSGVLVTVGDMSCTQTEVITPNGRWPLDRTVWVVQNNTTTTESIPAYAIVLAVLFFLVCLLGLLFLLIKERKTTGWMTVSVQGQGTYYATQIPVSTQLQVTDIESRVGYIRGLVAALG
jgi:hypothetical protein